MPFLKFGEIFCIGIYCVYVISLHTESTDSVIYGTDHNASIMQQTSYCMSARDMHSPLGLWPSGSMPIFDV